MSRTISKAFVEKTRAPHIKSAEIIEPITLKTTKKNQLLAFFKPEVFLDKTPEQTEAILAHAFKKLEEHQVTIDGAALFPGTAIGDHAIMDRHYGVINMLSKNASKLLTKEERDTVLSTLDITDPNTPILGGHEAYQLSDHNSTLEFDNYWLQTPATKIKSGFYARVMKIKGNDTVVVNGFHPHQLAHYTEPHHYLGVMLVSSDSDWNTLRVEMLGDTFPEKALPTSIRGGIYKDAQNFGFDSVSIANNIMHLSAGPTEALFEIDNFFKAPFGIDFIKDEAKLAHDLLLYGVNEKDIQAIIVDKALHGELEHTNTDTAVREIIKRYKKTS